MEFAMSALEPEKQLYGFALPQIHVPATWTLTGLLAGLVLGWALRDVAIFQNIIEILQPLGTLWLHGLQMTILPLMISLLVIGIAQTIATARGGLLARRTLGLFAGVLFSGAVMAAIIAPLLLNYIPIPSEALISLQNSSISARISVVPGVSAFFTSLVPSNVLTAASNDAILPTIVFFALFAIAITRLPESQNTFLLRFFESIASAMMILVGWVLALAPIGVFALSFSVTAQTGSAAITMLAHYILVVSAVGGVVLFAAYLLAFFAGKQSLVPFFKAMLPVHAVALATQSSLASLPAMLIASRKLGAKDSSAEFTLPLAVALFRATGPAMNLAVAIYVAYLTGVALTPMTLAAGIAVATITTLGAPSLPGAISFISSVGPIALAMGAPVAPLAILVAVEMLPDLMRTIGNVAMDVAVTTVVDRRHHSARS
jgi:Na+/H+-dicarboxylate symporter